MSAYPSMPGHPERVWGTASLRIAIRYSFDDLQPVHHIARDHKSSSRVLRGHQITIKGLVNELYLDDLRDKTHGWTTVWLPNRARRRGRPVDRLSVRGRDCPADLQHV